MNENCRGCKSLMRNKTECLFTMVGIESIPDCPCQTCLIRTVCEDPCDDLSKAHKLIGIPKSRYRSCDRVNF